MGGADEPVRRRRARARDAIERERGMGGTARGARGDDAQREDATRARSDGDASTRDD